MPRVHGPGSTRRRRRIVSLPFYRRRTTRDGPRCNTRGVAAVGPRRGEEARRAGFHWETLSVSSKCMVRQLFYMHWRASPHTLHMCTCMHQSSGAVVHWALEDDGNNSVDNGIDNGSDNSDGQRTQKGL